MLIIGEQISGRKLGYTGGKYVWSACIDCGRERWVELRKGKPANARCGACAGKIKMAIRDTTREHNPNWKGGIRVHPMGYIVIRQPEHPFAYSNGYVPCSRLVLEKKLGRYLREGYIPHHRNGIKTDDRPENLEEQVGNEHHSNHANSRRRDARGRFKASRL